MDMGWSRDMLESFLKYQYALKKEFDKIADEYSFEIIDAHQDVFVIQEYLRERIKDIIGEDVL